MNQRKGTIIDTEVRDDEFTLSAEVALNDMFGYSSQLRGMTQGKGESSVSRRVNQADIVAVAGEFSMEYKVSRSRLVFKLGTDLLVSRHMPRSCQTSKKTWSMHTGKSSSPSNRLGCNTPYHSPLILVTPDIIDIFALYCSGNIFIIALIQLNLLTLPLGGINPDDLRIAGLSGAQVTFRLTKCIYGWLSIATFPDCSEMFEPPPFLSVGPSE